MIKCVFFDIDGTLLNPETRSIPASTLASLKALRSKGVKLFVATGRFPAMTTFLEEFFPFDGFVTLNGQLAVDRNGTVLHRMAHDPEDIRTLVDLVKANPFPCLIIEEKQCFYILESQAIKDHFAWAGLPAPGPYDLSRLENHPVLQFLAYINHEDTGCLAPLKHIAITGSGVGICDIIPEHGGKDVGLAAVAKHYGWNRNEIMVFGDGNNDSQMLAWAGIGVAMGNGTAPAKDAADYVTTPVGEDGIKNALLHFGVLSEKDFEET